MEEKVLMLEGLKVLDFSKHVAGPAIGGMLAEHGASVIHIEKPGTGDDSRYYSPACEGYGSYYIWLNRGKKSVTMDLKDPEMQRVVRELIAETDIIVESFRPGVMKRLGLDYESVRAIKPDIIYASVSAFGQAGPYADRPGYDVIAQAASGLMNATGDPDGPPSKLGMNMGDTVSALNGFGSICLALYHRAMTGRGQHVDISLARSLMWHNMMVVKTLAGTPRMRSGNHDAMLCPYGIFEGNGGRHIVIGCADNGVWHRLCSVMKRGELAEDPRFATNLLRVEHREETIGIVEDWLRSMPSMEEAERALLDAAVPCSRVYGDEDILSDPHILGQDWFGEIPLPEGAAHEHHPVGAHGITTFSGGRLRNDPAPDLGADNREILGGHGISEAVLEEMERLNRRD